MGETYRELETTLKSVKILQKKPGEIIRFMKGDLEYRYSFYLKQKIKKIELKKMVREGKKRMAFSRLILEPAQEAGEARLFAVGIRLPMIPYQGKQKKSILDQLVRVYGKAVNLNRLYFDMENRTTLVRAYLSEYRGRRYLVRLTFVSRSLSAQRNKEILNLRKTADRLIRQRVREANKKTQKTAKKLTGNGVSRDLILASSSSPTSLKTAGVSPARQALKTGVSPAKQKKEIMVADFRGVSKLKIPRAGKNGRTTRRGRSAGVRTPRTKKNGRITRRGRSAGVRTPRTKLIVIGRVLTSKDAE